MKHKFFVYLALLGVIVYTYLGLWDTFFQQDEWQSLGLVYANGIFGNLIHRSPIELLTGTERFFGTLISNAFHYYLPFDATPFVMFSLFFHWVNASLLFFLIGKITNKPFLALVGSVFFAIANTPSQAVTWLAAVTTTLPSTTFLLLSLVLFFQGVLTGKQSYRFWSQILLIVSFYFKESSIFMFVLFPMLDWLFSRKRHPPWVFVQRYIPVFVFLIFLLIAKIFLFSGAEGQQGVFVMRGGSAPEKAVVHLLLYPIISLSQIFIPSHIMFSLASEFMSLNYEFLMHNSAAPAIAQILVSDLLSVYVSFFLLTAICIAVLFEKTLRRFAIFSILFYFCSFLPYAILDRPGSSYLESRYYYNGALAAGMFLGIIVYAAMAFFARWKNQILAVVMRTLIIVCVLFPLFKYTVFTQRAIVAEQITASERKKFLHQIKLLRPALPDKAIFFVSGDSPGFYGVADLTVPFQQGAGYTFMVWYFDSGKIPRAPLGDFHLWNINAQGYREVEAKGFGYFWDKQKLIELYQKDLSLGVDQVVGFYYVAGKQEVVDITDIVRNELRRARDASL